MKVMHLPLESGQSKPGRSVKELHQTGASSEASCLPCVVTCHSGTLDSLHWLLNLLGSLFRDLVVNVLVLSFHGLLIVRLQLGLGERLDHGTGRIRRDRRS